MLMFVKTKQEVTLRWNTQPVGIDSSCIDTAL